MSRDNSKPPSPAIPRGAANTAPAQAPQAKSTDGVRSGEPTGRVRFDERGNAIWEWSLATGAYGREVSAQRLQKLEHPALSIADDASPPPATLTVRANPLGTKKGYDPYDSGKLGKAAPRPRKTDLRKLSEWLKLKKQAKDNKDD